MPLCPVCQVRYAKSQTVCCPVCGWDLQPLTVLTGLIPEVVEKEAVRLQWAKTLWHSVQTQREKLHQLQIQLKETIEPAPQIQTPSPPASPEQMVPTDMVETLQPQKRIFPPANPPNPAKSQGATATAVALLPPQIATQAFDFDMVTIQEEKVERRRHSAFCVHQSLDVDINLEMVWVPGGRFWMGSPESEAERDSHEAPQHEVTLAPFYMSRFPITQAQWHAIAAQPKIQRSLSLYPANFEGDRRPVEMVSWYDAIEFCARLSQHAGQQYRLPSEAEWEYACRAGTTTPFHYGETLLPDWANYDGNYIYGPGRPGHYRQETTSVGASETSNAFGLADMHGNVWEWCADPWHENYDGAPTDGSVWTSDEAVNYQVLRGGAWYCLPGLCRSAQRHWNQPDVGGSGIGFRVVCVIP